MSNLDELLQMAINVGNAMSLRKMLRDAQRRVVNHAVPLFARCAIPASTHLGDFTGLVKAQQPHDPSKYLLELHRVGSGGEALDIDAQLYGNEMRFINDFQLVASEPSYNIVRPPLYGRPTNLGVKWWVQQRGCEKLS